MNKNSFESALDRLRAKKQKWLVTGCAGFIGSNLVEFLLKHNQFVVGLDNFATGHKVNLEEVKKIVSDESWKNFVFIEGDITNFETCSQACSDVDYVLHQAALGSVPRSIKDPLLTNSVNISGFLNMLQASKNSSVASFVYAASSSTYGDHPGLPKKEDIIGRPLSPYAVTKYVNELYAEVFARNYGFESIGLRYFNVFGKRQDPKGAYAAVIPKWISLMLSDEEVVVNGDGETSRDFCYIDNVIEANILAAFAKKESRNQIYNVALGDRTTLNELFNYLALNLSKNNINYIRNPIYGEFRAGDVRHSQADISKARSLLGYDPKWKVEEGIMLAMDWYIKTLKKD